MERKLKAEPRTDAGKGAARKIRALGRVPAVVYGHGAEPLLLDVSDPASIRAAAAELATRTDRLDALINNAGILLDDAG